jgi:hypothetical protein
MYVFGLTPMVIRRVLHYTLFFADALRIGEDLATKAPFNNNLPTQINDVIVNPINPRNPDSNTWLPRT